MTMADSTYSPLHSAVCYDASNIDESTTANRGRQDFSGFICLVPFRAFAWTSGAIVGFAIQGVSIFARVLSMVVDQGALKEHDFRLTVLRCVARLDLLVYLGILCSFAWVECRHNSPSWRRKSIFYLFMNAVIGLVFGTALSWILIAGAINRALPITETLFLLIFSCPLFCIMIALNDWREDEKDKKDGVESDLERPLIV
jgi:hypothetical protein